MRADPIVGAAPKNTVRASEAKQFTVTNRHKKLATVAEEVINTVGTNYKISAEAVAGWMSLFDRSNVLGRTLAIYS